MSAELPRIADPKHHSVLAAESLRLLEFGRAAQLPQGAFGWLDSAGVPTPDRPRMLYVTCRLTHSYALGAMLGVDGATQAVDHGLRALRETFRDTTYGGWYTSVSPANVADGSGAATPVDDRKWSYPHAFVILAAASATTIGRPGAAELLDEALAVMEGRFWDEDAGMAGELWDAAFTTLDPYRGANANMHSVEAFLAAYAATGRTVWLDRAERICERMTASAAAHSWRLPEHYEADWTADLERYRDRPSDPFKPYGATPGHGFEWARLLIHLAAGLRSAGRPVPEWVVSGAENLTLAAARDAWTIQDAPGLIYTVDWSGEPVITKRLHWVLAEALGAVTVLWQETGDSRYADWYAQWWALAEAFFIDTEAGSWHHELDDHNAPSATVRDGKADVYHALQATLFPRLAPAVAIAPAVQAFVASAEPA